MSERQAGVPQEAEGQRRLPTDAMEAGSQRRAEREDIGRAEVGQFTPFDVAPDLLDWIQVGGVARERLDRQPGPGPREILAHHAALVPTQPVPHQDDVAAGKVPVERAQERDQRDIVVAAGSGLEVTPAAPAVPAEGQSRRDRQARPVRSGVDQDRRVAPRGPRAADDGPVRDAAFIFEDDPGAPAPRVFFTCGQRRCFHAAIAASSRSRAWRVGRWSDHPSRRRMYQTWPGWYRTRVSRSISVATRGNVHSSVANP